MRDASPDVRELQNVVERAIVLALGKRVKVEDLLRCSVA